MAIDSLTFFSLFCAAWGTITGSSNSDVKTLPRLPRVKIVERFFKATLPEKILKKNWGKIWFSWSKCYTHTIEEDPRWKVLMAPKYPFVPLSHIHNAITNYTNTAEKLHVHLEKDISLSVILYSHKVVSIRLFFKLRKKITMINAQMKKMDTMLA